MKTVLHALNNIEANIIKGLLASEGISAEVIGEYLQGAMGELPPGNLVRVVVNEQDFDNASAIIDNWREAKFHA